ncbi:uncharacterized protein ACNS7B_019074 [Menidia menidia]
MALLLRLLWGSCSLIVSGAQVPSVIYPFTSTCAVRGSSLTLPCTFTPRRSFTQSGRNIPLRIVRVGWCQNHHICQNFFTSVYDSGSDQNDPRYQYLGDMKRNCTLRITSVQKQDNKTFRFRMQADNMAGHFTNQTGVAVRVVDWPRLRVEAANGTNGTLGGGQTASLRCTSDCSFHPLEVSWFRDGHALTASGPAHSASGPAHSASGPAHSASGPALRLGPLTAGHSGNYSCAVGGGRGEALGAVQPAGGGRRRRWAGPPVSAGRGFVWRPAGRRHSGNLHHQKVPESHDDDL